MVGVTLIFLMMLAPSLPPAQQDALLVSLPGAAKMLGSHNSDGRASIQNGDLHSWRVTEPATPGGERVGTWHGLLEGQDVHRRGDSPVQAGALRVPESLARRRKEAMRGLDTENPKRDLANRLWSSATGALLDQRPGMNVVGHKGIGNGDRPKPIDERTQQQQRAAVVAARQTIPTTQAGQRGRPEGVVMRLGNYV